jgi:putative zinc finger/helix-turn-helix YgiT family protein
MSVDKPKKRMVAKNRKKKGRIVSDDACPSCGTLLKETRGALSFPVNGEDMRVPALTYLKCPKCDEIVLRLDETRKLREGALDVYRKKYDLLSSDEIRSIRERLNLTQDDLAVLLRLGKNTISRWESGRIIQTAALDVLLRIIRDVPASLEYLKNRVA